MKLLLLAVVLGLVGKSPPSVIGKIIVTIPEIFLFFFLFCFRCCCRNCSPGEGQGLPTSLQTLACPSAQCWRILLQRSSRQRMVDNNVFFLCIQVNLVTSPLRSGSNCVEERQCMQNNMMYLQSNQVWAMVETWMVLDIYVYIYILYILGFHGIHPPII